MTDKILRRVEVQKLTGGQSKATIYRWVKNGEFPPPLRLGGNSVGWRESDVQAWVASRQPTIGTDASTAQ